MLFISWNVNGLRACLKKDFISKIGELGPDVLCLQETKMEKGQADVDLAGYFEYWNSADKKGYSGTAVFSKIEPENVAFGIGVDEHDHEGRVITLEFADYFLVNVYVPNSQRELVRLAYRMKWEQDFKDYVRRLDEKKPVIICGDLNVAHTEADIKNASSNRKNPGFTDDERQKMTELLSGGFSDSFRTLYPDKKDAYTWWSMMPGVREKNIGWRIDYFLVSTRLLASVNDALIYDNVYGSDHCPIGIDIF